MVYIVIVISSCIGGALLLGLVKGPVHILWKKNTKTKMEPEMYLQKHSPIFRAYELKAKILSYLDGNQPQQSASGLG